MKRLIFSLLSLILCLSVFAKKDVTKFLGIPVDGTEAQFVRSLKAKGFEELPGENPTMLKGHFNGTDVMVGVLTEKGKVCRVMVCDESPRSASDIKIRFNKLCRQFKDNAKYFTLEDYTIPDEEDIAYQMRTNDKMYKAGFYQLTEEYSAENLHKMLPSSDELENLSEEEVRRLGDSLKQFLNEIENNPVWFYIKEIEGEYIIVMYYDNEYNRAQGEDL